ncbi:MAG: ester cyclase [Thermoleophilia bacterium]
MTTTTEPAALAVAVIEMFNTADWDGMRAACAPDVVYTEAGTGRRLEGIDACMEAWAGWRSAMSDVTGTVGRFMGDGGTVVMELTWRGTHDGPLVTPDGAIPATGRRVTVTATQWQEHRRGRIATIDHHLDVLTLLTQIGAV